MNRHLWLTFVAAVLCLPLIIGMVAPDPDLIAQEESRRTAAAPGLPHSFNDWRAWPGATDAWLRDHFGLRRAMIRVHSQIADRWLGGGTQQAVAGLDGWLFFRGQDALTQSAGLVLREDQVVDTADTIARLHASLTARGIRFIVAIPPNSATIYLEHVPKWARNSGRRTEYDALLEALRERAVSAVDLRPPLRAAHANHVVYYQHDTHWNSRGAVIAFNTVASAAGHADWQFDPDAILGPAVEYVGGDLANLLGIPNVTDQTQYFTLPLGQEDVLAEAPLRTYRAELTETKADPQLLIIGDSFTDHFFNPLLLARIPSYIWTTNFLCTFDPQWIDKFHPKEVWWMPTERQSLCAVRKKK